MIIFDLFEAVTPVGKDIKDVATKAAVIKARMAHPTATSDIEALAKDMIDTQKNDEEEIARAQEINDRQDELLQQIRKLDRRQDDEIDSIEDEENDLVTQVKRLQAANAKLSQTIAAMKGKKAEVAETEVSKKSPHEQGMADIYYRGRGNAEEHGYVKGTAEYDQYVAGLKQGREDFGQEGEYGKDYTEESVEQPSDDVLKKLFKDFGDIFGKQPAQPKPQEKKPVNETLRAGYNPLTSKEHWHEVKNHLTKLLAEPSIPYEDKQVIRQRYLDKKKEAEQKGWEK